MRNKIWANEKNYKSSAKQIKNTEQNYIERNRNGSVDAEKVEVLKNKIKEMNTGNPQEYIIFV